MMMKAEIIAVQKDRYISTVSKKFPLPSVIRLYGFFKIPYRNIVLSRRNIMRRDENTCQYCGKKTSDMTIDHIIPRSRGGGDTWDNLVACCFK